ncbi:MAG: acyl-CoA synthetase, partial [Proteobacteria bacterium]|nr:acyl-CoA synthetase [Pseudomonadota bacterium]
MNVAASLLDDLTKHPSRVAIYEPSGKSITYDALYRCAVAQAVRLVNIGVQPGDRALIQIPNGIELTATALATMLVGATPVLCELGFGDRVYEDRVRAAAPSWLLVSPTVELLKTAPLAR